MLQLLYKITVFNYKYYNFAKCYNQYPGSSLQEYK